MSYDSKFNMGPYGCLSLGSMVHPIKPKKKKKISHSCLQLVVQNLFNKINNHTEYLMKIYDIN